MKEHKEYTYEELVDTICDLLCINAVDTIATEDREGTGPFSVRFALEQEMRILRDNIEEDVYKRFGEMLANAKEDLDAMGCDYLE